jgi:hypothetical protein
LVSIVFGSSMMNSPVPYAAPTFAHEAFRDARPGPAPRGGGNKKTRVPGPGQVASVALSHGLLQAPASSAAARAPALVFASPGAAPAGSAPAARIVKKPASVMVPVQMQMPGGPKQSVLVQMPVDSLPIHERSQGLAQAQAAIGRALPNRGWRGAVRSVAMSEQLMRVLGATDAITTRPKFNTAAYAYFRDRGLLDPANRRFALLRTADGKADPFFDLTVSPENPLGVARFNAFGPLKYVAHHLKAL